jgi:hypothetical protein
MRQPVYVLLALLLAACGPSQPVFEPASPSPTAAPTGAVAPDDPCHLSGQTWCVLNPAVTPATVRQTVCVAGWTATQRPPQAYTSALKRQQLQQLHLSGPASAYEEDHRLPLEGGGAPRDPYNLTPEPLAQAHAKDQAENQLRAAICAGGDLRQLQVDFVTRWLAPWPGFEQLS